MDKEELKAFVKEYLKDNMTVSVYVSVDGNEVKTEVQLHIENECIDTSGDSFEVNIW